MYREREIYHDNICYETRRRARSHGARPTRLPGLPGGRRRRQQGSCMSIRIGIRIGMCICVCIIYIYIYMSICTCMYVHVYMYMYMYMYKYQPLISDKRISPPRTSPTPPARLSRSSGYYYYY